MYIISNFKKILLNPNWLQGILLTLSLTLISLLIGAFLGVFFSLCSMSKRKHIQLPINSFIFIIKGTPILVQIFITYYGIGFLASKQSSFLSFIGNPFFCALFALSINSASYMSSLIKGAIESIAKGQYLSAKALGMTKFQAYKSIIIPQIIQKMLPSYSNEAIILLKSTSLVSTITLMDIMGVGNQIMAKTYDVGYCVVIMALIYISLNIILSKSIESLAKKY